MNHSRGSESPFRRRYDPRCAWKTHRQIPTTSILTMFSSLYQTGKPSPQTVSYWSCVPPWLHLPVAQAR
jgi:hypothetical protein